MSNTTRLQKVLSERGIASRRTAAEIVSAGRVKVNGQPVTEAGFRVDTASDKVLVDGRPLPEARETPRTIAMYKPRGYICSRSGAQGKTVFDLLPDVEERLVPVGRLDKNSEGLLLLSNDGDLVNRLTHPRHGHKKTYHVTVSGNVDDSVLRRLNQPFELDGYQTQPAQVQMLDRREGQTPTPVRKVVLEITLTEGRNRQIRDMSRQCRLRVHRLRRISVGQLHPTDLQPGQWRDLSPEEIALTEAG